MVSRRVDASRASSPASFGLDSSRDILRGVAGQPEEPLIYGRQLVGSDAVVANLKVGFDELAEVAARMLVAYRDTHYRQRFAWIDQVKMVRDVALTDALDEQLLSGLAADAEARPYLAPPAMLPWSNVEFTFTGGRGTRYRDIDLDEYLAGRDLAAMSVERLRSDQVRAVAIDSDLEIDRWTAYSCLVFETRLGQQAYVLSESQWFEISTTLVEDIRARLQLIPRSTVSLPPAQDGEWEESYNIRAAAFAPGRALLDRKLSRVAAEHGPIEICDVFTPDGELVHVKRRTQSATLSHLFAQGRISAEVIRRDPELREELRASLAAVDESLGETIPSHGNPFDPSALEIVYAIVTENPEDLPHSLPFFSRLNLARTHEYLTDTLGYRASLIGVGFE